MVNTMDEKAIHRRNIPPVTIEGVDIDERPLDINEIRKKAYPDV